MISAHCYSGIRVGDILYMICCRDLTISTIYDQAMGDVSYTGIFPVIRLTDKGFPIVVSQYHLREIIVFISYFQKSIVKVRKKPSENLLKNISDGKWAAK